MLERFTWFKQSSLLWRDRLTVYIDPWGVADGDPEADVVFITHAHFDHFNQADLAKILGPKTVVVCPHDVAAQMSKGDVRAVKPGESIEAAGIAVEVVPAYNVTPEREQYHPRDNAWVGYVLALGGTRYYLAGDTDHIPEMSEIKADVAFLPIGGIATMDVPEAAAAAKSIEPTLAVPLHFGFLVGTSGLGDEFVAAIAPIEGRVMRPRSPFER